MVLKILSGGNNGDFDNALDFFGNQNDTVLAGVDSSPFSYEVYTYRGDDQIDLRDASAANEYAVFAGGGNDTILGSNGVDSFVDQTGNDIFRMGGNDDLTYAGSGNDVYDGGAGTDTLAFTYIVQDSYNQSNQNLSLNTQRVKVDLALTTVQDFGIFGKDVIKSIENLYGSPGIDVMYGTAEANIFIGEGGNDYLEGRGGNDLLNAGAGADTLVGGTGGDTFILSETSTGRDHVRYYKTSESSASSDTSVNVDVIQGFDQGGLATDDRIDLTRIDARASTTTVNDAFIFRGVGGAFSSAQGEIRIVESEGNSYVYVDTDADASVEMRIVVSGVTGLTAADFIL